MRELPIRKPSSTPTTIAMPKPTIVTQKVRHAWPRMVVRCSQNCSAMRTGLGKMNSLTLNRLHTPCHTTSVASIRISGDQRSRDLGFMGRPSLWQRDAGPADRLANGTDVAAQLVHDVGELARVRDLEVARPWQVDLAAHDHAPGALAHHVDGVG